GRRWSAPRAMPWSTGYGWSRRSWPGRGIVSRTCAEGRRMRTDAARVAAFAAACLAASAVGFPGMPEPRGQWLVLVAAYALVGGLLAVLTRSLPGTRRSRALLLGGAVFGILQLGTLVEYAVFSTALPADVLRQLAAGLCATALF